MADDPIAAPPSKGYIVKTRGHSNARANFACLSKQCRTKKGAAVYELPVAAVRCPVCSSRKITRIFTPPHISAGKAKQVDRMMEADHVKMQRHRDDAKASARTAPMLGASLKNGVAGALQEGMAKMGYPNHPVPWGADPMGKARPAPLATPQIVGMKAHGAVRVPSLVDPRQKWVPTPEERAAAAQTVDEGVRKRR